MVLEKIYNFNRKEYDDQGFHREKSFYLFIDFINECERDFFKEFNPYFANAFYANSSVLYLLQSCFNTEDKDIFGMESIDGQIDIEMNLKMDEFSENDTIYSLSSCIEGKDDEPLLIVKDSIYSDSQFSLKCIPDFDQDEDEMDFLTDPKQRLTVRV